MLCYALSKLPLLAWPTVQSRHNLKDTQEASGPPGELQPTVNVCGTQINWGLSGDSLWALWYDFQALGRSSSLQHLEVH